jgi:hypothetical protein
VNLRAPALTLLLLALAAGCGEGYPTGDPAETPLTPADRVERVSRKLAANETEVRSVALVQPCLLDVHWKASEATEVALPDLEVVIDTDTASGNFIVFLKSKASGAVSPLFISTADWADMTMVRSDLDQLRAACAEAQPPD